MICPKCGNKIPQDSATCSYCKLRVDSIITASNEEAKRAIKFKQKDRVLMSTYIPKDVSKTKLLLLCIFLGWTGAHCFYVGRMVKASIMLVSMILSIVFVCIPETWILHAYLSGVVAGIFGFICVFNWWFDILLICFNKFKIPVVLKGYEIPKEMQ